MKMTENGRKNAIRFDYLVQSIPFFVTVFVGSFGSSGQGPYRDLWLALEGELLR